MSSKAKEIMEDNMSDAIYDNITGGYSGSIEGYNKATEQCVRVANEYAKEISIGFMKWNAEKLIEYAHWLREQRNNPDPSLEKENEIRNFENAHIELRLDQYLQSLNQ